MRGQVTRYDTTKGTGTIRGEDGARYALERAALQGQSDVAIDAEVDFTPEGGTASRVYVLAGPASAESQLPPGHASLRHGLGPWGYFKKCLRLYADGKGRATRGEYWSFILFFTLLFLVPVAFFVAGAVISEGGAGQGADAGSVLVTIGTILAVLLYLGLLVPTITVMLRRLHDLGLSGWLWFVGLVPYVGGLFLFVCSLIPSSKTANAHGPSPKDMPATTADAFA